MTTQLTEAEAWREIARRIAEGDWSGHGLCCEVNTLWDDCLISAANKWVMRDRIKDHIGYDEIWTGTFGLCGPWAFTPGDVDVRVLAALFLAEDAR